jgi:glycosyltransferase involved in cell wall biosynthesis
MTHQTLSARDTPSRDTFANIGAARAAGPLAGQRVLIIVENLPVPFDRRVWQEARALTAAGAKVSVICPVGKGYEALEETIEGIDIFRHPLPAEASSARGYLKEYAAALWHETRLAWKVFFRNGIDVIHGCNPPDLIFLVALQFRLLGRKFIFDHHDINPELYEAKFGRRDMFWRLVRLVERLTFLTAHASIATNDSYRRIAIERGRMPPDKVFVVRSGPDLSRLKTPEPNPALRRGRKHLVGYVGVMGEQEGVDLLLEAVAHLVAARGRQDIQFCLVGGGPSLETYRKLSEKMGLTDYVTFMGRVPDHDLFEVLATADVCVNPDRVNAMNDMSTMNKILEYMALGKPIVQFDVAEGRVSAGEASLYAAKNDPVDMARKIEDLLADPAARARMGEAGRQRIADSLSWDHQTPQLIAAYRTALKLDDTRAG